MAEQPTQIELVVPAADAGERLDESGLAVVDMPNNSYDGGSSPHYFVLSFHGVIFSYA